MVKRSRALTVTQYAEGWVQERPLKHRTRVHYAALIRNHIAASSLGPLAIKSLTPAMMRTWHAGLDPAHKTAQAHAYSLLHAICATAVEDRLLEFNPCSIKSAMSTPVQQHRQVVGLAVVLRGSVVVAGAARYKGYRFPIEVIGHAVWLYHRFALSLRDVEELLLARGVVVSHETVRSWCARFGPDYAKKLRRRRPCPGDKWHLDEVFIKINGATHYLWRAVDQDGEVLDILVQSKRNRTAAKRFFRKLLKGLQYVPRVLVTDKLGSYGVAHRESMPSVQHRRSKYLNNRAENSHQPTRVRERVMKRFASPGQAQRFLYSFGHIRGHFRPRRHLVSAPQWRSEMADRFDSLGRNHRRCGGVKPHCQPTHHGF